MLTLGDAGVLQGGELVKACGDEQRAGEQRACRHQAGIKKREPRKDQLQRGKCHGGAEPDADVADR